MSESHLDPCPLADPLEHVRPDLTLSESDRLSISDIVIVINLQRMKEVKCLPDQEFAGTNLLFISVAAKLVFVVYALCIVHIDILFKFQSLQEAVASLNCAALIRGPCVNSGKMKDIENNLKLG